MCARCGAPGAWPVARCAECAGRRLGFASARAAIVYDSRARAFVRAWKEQGRRDLACEAAELVVSVVPAPAVDVVTFVPGDRERGLRRGHAPPARLARELGARWGLPVAALLDRRGRHRRQAGLGSVARRRNVVGAFHAGGAPAARVCLVDDVYTTGATAAACACALRRAGARQVTVACFARAVR